VPIQPTRVDAGAAWCGGVGDAVGMVVGSACRAGEQPAELLAAGRIRVVECDYQHEHDWGYRVRR
jgi:hypothetical protein